MDKYLYFRAVDDEDNDDGDTASAGTSPTSLCIPASSLVSIAPTSDTTVTLSFQAARTSHFSDGRASK